MSAADHEELHRFTFGADGETLSAVRVGNGHRSVVVLHGAGQSDKERLLPFMGAVADLGFAVWALDFAGHGSSSGQLVDSSLQQRVTQAAALGSIVAETSDLSGLVGFSMSGQTVTDLIDELEPDGICLLNPAAYGAATLGLRFGEGFTEAIRRPESWAGSPAFEALAGFGGSCVLVTSEHDDVIPADVFERYEHAGRSNSGRFERLVVRRAPHAIGRWMSENPAGREIIVEAVGRALGR